MKKLLSTLFLAAAVPATMLAKPMTMESLKPSQLKVTPEINNSFIKADAKINPAILAEKQGKTVYFDTIPAHGYYTMFYGSSFYGDRKAIQYDENTNTVYVVHNHFTMKNASVPTSETRGRVRVLTYTDGGTVEGEVISLFDQTNKFCWATSFDLANPSKSNLTPAVNILAFSEQVYNDPDGSGNPVSAEKSGFLFYDPAKIVNDEPTRAFKEEAGPSANYNWRSLNPTHFSTSDSKPFYVAGAPLFAKTGTGALQGRYGVIVLDNADLHDIEYSDTPNAFEPAKFQAPTENSHYNSPMFFGQDDAKNLYAFVNNIHASDLTKRLPAFAVSNDNGVSWGALNIMDWKVFDAYVAPHAEGIPTEDLTFGFQPFRGTDFLMQGNGDFSYVAKMYAQNKETNALYVFDIVEVFYEGKKWGIRKVEDMRMPKDDGTYGFASLLSIFEASSDPVKEKLCYDIHDRANELELGITKDRQYLVMKWIDYKFTRDEKGDKIYDEGDESITYKLWYQTDEEANTWTERDFTGFTPTAIYIKYRKIGTNEWSEHIQLTNDERYHMHTHMPDVIPSLENIPMITSFGNDSRKDVEGWPATYLPAQFKDMLESELKTPIYHVFNASASVKDSKETKDAISVYPNPASNSLTVSCEPNSTVEIFNTLGEKMMDVKGNTANVSSLANGIYLVKVTNGGKVTSTLFTVAK